MMLASIAEPMEQREPTCLHDWPSRERGRRSQRERFRAKLNNIRRDIRKDGLGVLYPFGLRQDETNTDHTDETDIMMTRI